MSRSRGVGPEIQRAEPDGQITLNFLSSPSHKNIPLNASGKSAALLRASHPIEGRIAIVTNVR
jgi:hypothetical protein